MREWIEAEAKSFSRKNQAGKAETLTGGQGRWNRAAPLLDVLGELDRGHLVTQTPPLSHRSEACTH